MYVRQPEKQDARQLNVLRVWPDIIRQTSLLRKLQLVKNKDKINWRSVLYTEHTEIGRESNFYYAFSDDFTEQKPPVDIWETS